eukprot:1682565-Prymnesium_polylepis.1
MCFADASRVVYGDSTSRVNACGHVRQSWDIGANVAASRHVFASPSRRVTARCAAPRIQPRPAPGAGAGRMRGCASLTRPV